MQPEVPFFILQTIPVFMRVSIKNGMQCSDYIWIESIRESTCSCFGVGVVVTVKTGLSSPIPGATQVFRTMVERSSSEHAEKNVSPDPIGKPMIRPPDPFFPNIADKNAGEWLFH